MGSLRLTLCAGAVCATALTPVAAAHADEADVQVSSSSPAPGDELGLRVRGCAARAATAESAAFVADTRLTGEDGVLAGAARVRSPLRPGTYPVRVHCGGAVTDSRFDVVREERPADRSQDRRGPEREPAAPASPVAPVRAGGGGTARLSVSEARATGPGTPHAVVGLVLAGVAAVAVAVRSARRGRGGVD
ncbi:hypothetical protein [Streptomyces minutiscleroticus]|uniref:Secreted protein n=1 Tax=Streptomyces minutiscleroticus TaxID=68238 RepID=A0A918KJ44_9ACTN|nr:hypothetical protein [Streptomyces minutiscleroticus]GGX64834.1 hypothetical protein GCM10010358_19000 [Streptomyces minutiscleroticus]